MLIKMPRMPKLFFWVHWKQNTRQVFLQSVIFMLVFLLGFTFGYYVLFYRYTPENHHAIFQMMMDKKHHVATMANHSNGNNKTLKVLFCTMITDDFYAYSMGAIKLGKAIHKDIPTLQSKLGLFVETAVVELKERPMPLKIWVKLRDEGGWQRKLSFNRLAPRHEGREVNARFKDQFTKLRLWTLDEQGFDWVFYMDSDMFVVRSLVPLFDHVIYQNNCTSSKLWVIRDFPEFTDAFNMGLFAMQPNSTEFERLVCLLQGGCKGIFPVQFAESWAEQGFLNAVYENQWTDIPYIYGMNLAIWGLQKDVWDANATHIQAVHFTMVKPWNWWCIWTQYAPLCYLFWHRDEMQFHKID